jgi:MoaA/NifB/PqqE/SkfB family radical SAM enzyme
MVRVQAVRGWSRSVFLLWMKLAIFFHFLPAARKLSVRRFVLFLRRLLLFLSRLDHNKYVRLGAATRLDLYVPSFPTPAFFAGCRKFMVFDEPTPCVTALVSITSACRFACPHCYQRRDLGRDMPIEALVGVVGRLQKRGVAFFNIEGGEPFLVYERLKQVCAAIDHRSEVWVNSTGDGITLERLRELKTLNLTAVMFSLHTAEPAKLNDFMGSDKAWSSLENGVALCHTAEVPVAFNACLGREAFYNGEFERVMDRAKAFHGCIVQLIIPKPAGAWLESAPARFTAADKLRVEELVRRYNHDSKYAVYPAVAAQILEEDSARFGCTAGGTDRFYINAKGDVQPCEFLHLSFGNVTSEDFEAIYARMRRAFTPPCETWLCEACAPQIGALAATAASPLPLRPELAACVHRDWERGKPTKFYAEIEQLK